MSGKLEILFADNHLVAVSKPAGLPTVPDASEDDSLLDWVRAWIRSDRKKPGNVFVGVVHRLDRPVSGIVVFARTSKAASRLAEAFRTRAVEKVYWGVGAGRVEREAGEFTGWLVKDERANRVRFLPSEAPGALQASTTWRVLAREADRVLLDLRPKSGRPHQLRITAAELGAPLLGDLKYGASQPLADRSIALHAVKLVLPHPTRGTPVSLSCPPPVRPWFALAHSQGV
jgi:23S rRNA pseudouridine1911/1915/1917 synthase